MNLSGLAFVKEGNKYLFHITPVLRSVLEVIERYSVSCLTIATTVEQQKGIKNCQETINKKIELHILYT